MVSLGRLWLTSMKQMHATVPVASSHSMPNGPVKYAHHFPLFFGPTPWIRGKAQADVLTTYSLHFIWGFRKESFPSSVQWLVMLVCWNQSVFSKQIVDQNAYSLTLCGGTEKIPSQLFYWSRHQGAFLSFCGGSLWDCLTHSLHISSIRKEEVGELYSRKLQVPRSCSVEKRLECVKAPCFLSGEFIICCHLTRHGAQHM